MQRHRAGVRLVRKFRRNRLQHHRVADLIRRLHGLLRRVRGNLGWRGYPVSAQQVLGLHLVERCHAGSCQIAHLFAGRGFGRRGADSRRLRRQPLQLGAAHRAGNGAQRLVGFLQERQMRRFYAQRAAVVGLPVRGQRDGGDRLSRARRQHGLDHGKMDLGAIRAAGLGRQLLLEQYHIHARIVLQCRNRSLEIIVAGQHRESAVDWIADERADTKDCIEFGRRLFCERVKYQAVALGGFQEHAAKGAGMGDRAEPPALRHGGVHQEFGDFDRVVQRVDADHTEVGRHRVERFHRAGKRAGMRHGGGAAAFRLSEFHGDNRLAGLARHTASRLELGEVGDCLDIEDDHLQLGLVGEEGDVVGNA